MPRSYDVSVVVPWHPSDAHRERAWEWVRARYAAAHPAWEVVEGVGGEPWCKAAAVADGLTNASGEIIIIADADVWVSNLEAAVDTLRHGAPWVIPHHLVHRLAESASSEVYAGAEPGMAAAQGLTQRPYPGWPGGGVVVVRREDYERAPMDPRFNGWGQEDLSFATALDCLVGLHARLDADLWHLWHPPQQRLSRAVGSRQSEALGEQYRQARRRPDLMAQLVEEGRAAWPVSL